MKAISKIQSLILFGITYTDPCKPFDDIARNSILTVSKLQTHVSPSILQNSDDYRV